MPAILISEFRASVLPSFPTRAEVVTTLQHVWPIYTEYNAEQAENKAVGAIIEQISQRRVESRTLAALRDALLPRLISGELRVKDGERFAEEARS